MNPLKSVNGSIVTSLVLAAIVAVWATVLVGRDLAEVSTVLARWLHIVSGVMWIGLLYYFNVVQVPGLAAAAADQGGPGGAGISKYIAPRALLWFRWAAVVTWITGAWYMLQFYGGGAGIHKAFTLQEGFRVIGAGAWMGTIMLFNVWVLIWPNQKKVLGLVPASDEEKARARSTALLASRTNFVLSVPMLLCMGGQSHGLGF